MQPASARLLPIQDRQVMRLGHRFLVFRGQARGSCGVKMRIVCMVAVASGC